MSVIGFFAEAIGAAAFLVTAGNGARAIRKACSSIRAKLAESAAAVVVTADAAAALGSTAIAIGADLTRRARAPVRAVAKEIAETDQACGRIGGTFLVSTTLPAGNLAVRAAFFVFGAARRANACFTHTFRRTAHFLAGANGAVRATLAVAALSLRVATDVATCESIT